MEVGGFDVREMRWFSFVATIFLKGTNPKRTGELLWSNLRMSSLLLVLPEGVPEQGYPLSVVCSTYGVCCVTSSGESAGYAAAPRTHPFEVSTLAIPKTTRRGSRQGV